MVISTKNHTSTFSPTKSHHISQSGKFSFLFNCIPKSNLPNILEKFYLIIQLIKIGCFTSLYTISNTMYSYSGKIRGRRDNNPPLAK